MSKFSAKKYVVYLVLGLVITVHILILTKLIYFPYPELFIYPYLTNQGLKPYAQILDQHFPGLLFFPINFDNLGMNTSGAALIWSISIIIIIHVMLFFIGSKILESKKKALWVNLLFLLWNPFFEGWVLWIDSFLPLFLLPAFYALYEKKILITGILLGIAVVFKQTVIPLSVLVFLYIILTTRNYKSLIIFLLGLSVPIFLMVAYVAGIGVWKDFWYWTVVFNLTTYAQSGTKAPPSLGYVTRVLLVYAASAPAIFYKSRRAVSLLFIFLLGSLIGAFERGDFIHLQPSLPFVVLATVIGFDIFRKKRIFKLIILAYILMTVWWLNIFYKGHISSNIISFDPQTVMLASKIRKYTLPGEKIFIFGAPPHLYQMSGTLPAGDLLVFQFPWFLKVSGDRVLEGIIRDKPKIIVSDRSAIVEDAKLVDFAKAIDRYINDNYQRIDSVGNTEILRRKS